MFYSVSQPIVEAPPVKPIEISKEPLEQFADLNDDEYVDEIYEIIDAVVPRSDDNTLPALTFRGWVLGLGFGVLLCLANTIFPFRTNGYSVSAFVAVLHAYPCGLFMERIGLNVMSEFLIGLILPGRIAAVMAFKTLSYMSMNQGLTLVASQVVGAILSTVVACPIYESFVKVPPLKDTEDQYPWGWQWKLQTMEPYSGWTSQGYNKFLSADAIWGSIGPARFFGPDSPYFKTLLGFIVGFILPIIRWLLHKFQPDSFWHLVNFPVVLIMINEPGINQAILITHFLIAIGVNYFIKKYRHTWWKKKYLL
ncbi:OPT oligopeptide transporter protein-domain-containing protein [Chytriomyces sp. MP71]|nr:OPT oligopeptide transporter protein-domain-containing protein [Chytriomyces sp. MP71]